MNGHVHNTKKTQIYQQDLVSEKQNIPLKMNYGGKKDKKFTYGFQAQKTGGQNSRTRQNTNQKTQRQDQIQRLRRQLRQEKDKVKYLQCTIIQQQSTVLQHLQLLQGKFQQVTSEKHHLQVELHRQQNQKGRLPSLPQQKCQSCIQKYQKLEKEHKKIKNIADSLIEMMKKVDGVEGNVHDAWKWVKKIVWQYEGIRSKALEWKSAYDQVNEAMTLIDK